MNVSLSILFLPRQLGLVENTVAIQTSVGTFMYQVSGRGIENPYGIQPLVGVKVR